MITLAILLVTLIQLMGIATCVHSIMSSRTPQGSIAWAISLVTFPYLALPAYWIFGRNRFRGYVLARRRDLERSEVLSERARAATRNDPALAEQPIDIIQGIEKLARVPITTGNRVDLLIDGEASFDSMLAGMDEARHYILIQFFIVRDDGLGRRVKAKLIERAKSGIAVFFLYDEIGSNKLPASYVQSLRDAGVRMHAFGTSRGRLTNRFQINFRNHRKIVVVDGRISWIGGHNIGDEYLGHDPEVGHWRDTHVRIEGPATAAVQLAFAEDWHWAAGFQLEQLDWSAHRPPDARTAALVVASGPADPLETAALLYTQAIASAQKRLWIASPYFVPENGLTAELQLAALRGVDVRILLPEKPDHLMVWLAAHTFIDEISRTGAKFYSYTAGFLHEKAMVIDDAACAIGTANFDNRSFRLNFEITCVFIDPEVTADVAAMFEIDFTKSRRLAADAFASKPAWFRLAARASRLASPLL